MEQTTARPEAALKPGIVMVVGVVAALGIVITAVLMGGLTTPRAILLLILWLALTSAGYLAAAGIIRERPAGASSAGEDRGDYKQGIRSLATAAELLVRRVSEMSELTAELNLSSTAMTTAWTARQASGERLAGSISNGAGEWRALVQHLISRGQRKRELITDWMRRVEQATETSQNVAQLASDARLTAFNATIEATGAGEAGMRFEAVAREFRAAADGLTAGIGQLKKLLTDLDESSRRLEEMCLEDQERLARATEPLSGMEAGLAATSSDASSGAATSDKLKSLAAKFDWAAAALRENAAQIKAALELLNY